MKSQAICSLILVTILVTSLLPMVQSVCIPRAFDGKTRVDAKAMKSRAATCNTKLKPKECAELQKDCLWISSNDHGYVFEGATIASTKYIPLKVAKPEQRKSYLKKKPIMNAKTKQTLKAEQDETYKKALKILTVDEDNIMYEISFTDFETHIEAAEKAGKEADHIAKYLEGIYQKEEQDKKQNRESKKVKLSPQDAQAEAKKLHLLIRHHSDLQSGYSFRRLLEAQNTSDHEMELDPVLSNHSSSRRLLWTNAQNLDASPYKPMALLRSLDRVGGDTATGFVIHRGQRHSRGVIGFRTFYRFIYVAVAAHDLVMADGESITADITHWRLYPKYNNLQADNWQVKEPTGLRLKRAWILQAYTDNIQQNVLAATAAAEQAYRDNPQLTETQLLGIHDAAMDEGLQNGADIAVLKFETPDYPQGDIMGYTVHAPAQGANQGICAYKVGGNDGPMILRSEANVDVTCEGSLCTYTGHELAPGNCGGAVYESNANTNAFAMHVAIDPDPSCTGIPNWDACVGWAVKMTDGRRKAIKSILAWNKAWGRNIEVFRELFTARGDYQNVYPYRYEEEAEASEPMWDNHYHVGYGNDDYMLFFVVIVAWIMVCLKCGCCSMVSGFLLTFNFEAKDIPFINMIFEM